MSWIIRSSTTPTSVERKVKPLARTASMYFGLRSCDAAAVEGRIESLDVADLEHDAAPPGDGHQFVGLGQRGTERLFDQHVDAGFEQFAGRCDGAGWWGRRSRRRRADPAGRHSRPAPRCGTAAATRSRLAATGSTTATSSTSLQSGEFLGVEAAQPSGTRSRRCEAWFMSLPRLLTLPRRRSRPRPCWPSCWPWMKLSKWLTCGTSWPLARRISQAFSRPTFER